MRRPSSSKIVEGKRRENVQIQTAIAALVLSLMGAAGSASGATVQSIAALRSWLMHQGWNALSFIGVTGTRLAECGSIGSSFLIWLR